MMMTPNGIENLSNAIILQAVRDYRKALKILKRHPRHKEAKGMVKDCEDFFESKWFSMLTNIDGKVLMEKLKQEV